MTNKLKHVSCWLSAEDNNWYMSLVYEYDGTDGLHQVTYPKVELPFTQNSIPKPIEISFEPAFLMCKMNASLYDSDVKDPRNGEIYNHVVMTDILVEPKRHKLTLAEIEDRLGYKIEIVDKKD